jgi:hypothetical protein
MDPYTTQLLVLNQVSQWSHGFVDQLKSWLISLALVIAGLVVAEVAKFLAAVLLRLVRLDAWGGRIGLLRGLRFFRSDVAPTVAAGHLVFWLTWLTFFMKALERLDIGWLAWAGQMYFAYLPLSLEALLIMAACAWLARGLGAWLRYMLDGSAAFLAPPLLQALVVCLGAFYALEVLGVDHALAQPLVLILFGASALGLSVGWAIQPHRFSRPVIRVEDGREEGTRA